MSNIIEVVDAEELQPVSEFKYGKWDFEKFNPVQSALLPFVEKNVNGLVAANTSAGKTVTSELFGSYAIRKLKKKFLFLCPLRSLANEKYNDWKNPKHHFSDLKISILTGDYRGDVESLNFDDSDVIIMTSEMLNHKLRVSKKNRKFVLETGVVCVDESHLLTVEGRGDHLESALINFSKINPEARLIFLSATLPNVNEVAGWMSESLNGKDTFIIKSKYRPCKLEVHTCTYDDMSSIRPAYMELIDEAISIVCRHISDKFIVFVHSKKIGRAIIQELYNRNIEAKFHNADLKKEERAEIEERFKNDKSLRVIVATSTLAQGLNLPARRVVIVGVFRGTEIVPSYEIMQELGRAGRPAFDPKGDGYILLPESRRTELEKKVLTPEPIQSRMLDINHNTEYSTMAFHILYEIYCGNITEIDGANLWFTKTLAFYQNRKLNQKILQLTIDKLIKLGLIVVNSETSNYEVTGLGKVSVIFYADPFNIASWARNFSSIFKKESFNDVDVCLAFANIGDNLIGSLSKADKASMKPFLEQVRKINPSIPENIQKIAYLYYNVMNGRFDSNYSSMMEEIKKEVPRTIAVIQAIDSFSKKWNRKGFLNTLAKRFQHGVPAYLCDLIAIKGVGKVKAEKLFKAGFKNKNDIQSGLNEAAKIVGINSEKLNNSLKEKS